jgi:D-alanyl-D-alanine carboxypeptidase
MRAVVYILILSVVIEACGTAIGAGREEGSPKIGQGQIADRELADSALVAALRSFTEHRIEKDSLSGVVMLLIGDAPAYVRTAGKADKEKDRPITTSTKFNLASVDKYFTRIAIRQLQQQGKLKIDDKVGIHLPDYPNDTVREEVTIAMLLGMQAGLPDYTGADYYKTLHTLTDLDAYIKLFQNKPLAFRPGSDKAYDNSAYVLLGKIIEKVSGKSYYTYVSDHIFGPAGMMDTGYPTLKELDDRTAVPYTNSASANGNFSEDAAELPQRVNATSLLPMRGSSTGGGYSTAEDLAKLARAIHGHVLLNESYTDSLLRFRKTGPGEFDFDGWAGGSEGVNTIFYMHSTGHTIIVLSNYDPPSASIYRNKMWKEWLPAWVKRTE